MGKSKNRQRQDGRETNNYKYKTETDNFPSDKSPDKFLAERTIELKPQTEKQRDYINKIKSLNMVIATGFAGCVDQDTEFLSPMGWIKMNQWDGDEVAQINSETSEISFTMPVDYIKAKCDFFKEWDYGLTCQTLSEDHRVPNLKYDTTLVGDLTNNKEDICTPSNFYSSDPVTTNLDTDFLDLICWLKKPEYKDDLYTFNLKDITHVYNVFLAVLSTLNIEYTLTNTTLQFKYTPTNSFNKIIIPKNSSDLYKLVKLICEDKIPLFALDQVQLFANASDHTTRIVGNKLIVDKVPFHILDNTQVKDVKSIDGYKYCFTVETGFLLLRKNGSIFITGNSSKTYCPTMIAAQMLRDRQIDRIILIRSPVSDEESVGMLKGDLIEKTKYWLMPILDTLNKALTPTLVDLLIKREQILCLAPEFLKGVSFTKRDFVIFDEAEDMSKTVALATVTRQGGGKMVLCGDLRQKMITRESGLPLLLDVIEKTPKLQEKVGIIDFDSYEDIVRSEDCRDWVKAFVKLGKM